VHNPTLSSIFFKTGLTKPNQIKKRQKTAKIAKKVLTFLKYPVILLMHLKKGADNNKTSKKQIKKIAKKMSKSVDINSIVCYIINAPQKGVKKY